MKQKFIVFLRVLLGAFFATLGFMKLLVPHQNFLYVIQSYDIDFLSHAWVAISVPWLEFILGVFLFLGLWLPFALLSFLGMTLGFILVIGQALIRKLPLQDCGCFGEFFSMPPEGMIFIDLFLFLAFFFLLAKLRHTSRWSLDKVFE